MGARQADPAIAAAAIRELLLAGHTVDLASERGVTGGWTRADVMTVVRANGWNLDRSGRIPLRDRPRPTAAARPGRRPPVGVVPVPTVPNPALAAVADWAETPPPAKPARRRRPLRAVAETPPVPPVEPEAPTGPPTDVEQPSDEQIDALVDAAEPLVEHQLAGEEPDPDDFMRLDDVAAVCELQRRVTPQPVDVLALGLEHRHPAVRAKAKLVARAVDDLFAALDRHGGRP